MAEMSAERLLMSAADSMGNRSIGPVARELRALADRAGLTQDQAAAGLADGSIKSTNKTMLNAIRGAITSAVNYTADALTIPTQYIPPELRGKGKQLADLAGMFSPGADVMDAAQSSGDMMDAARRGDLMGMAGAGAGIAAAGLGMFVPGTAKGYASAAEGMARGSGAAADAGGSIRAYHGSPHNFDRFDGSRVGTGETGKLQGKGLYFSDSQDVGKYYRDEVGGQNGRLYEVDIAAPSDDFLHMGKPLSEQGQRVKDALASRLTLGDVTPEFKKTAKGYSLVGNAAGRVSRFGSVEPVGQGFIAYSKPNERLGVFQDLASAEAALRREATARGISWGTDKTTGEQALNALGPKDEWHNILREMGLPGIAKSGEYQSGPATDYSVFDDRLISILRNEGRNADMTPAQEVAGMLKAGRGAEVTEEMIAKADPAELFDLYGAGKTGMDMPMDEASRMARAQGMYADAAKGAKQDFKVMGLRTVEEPDALLARSSVWDDGAPTDVQLKGASATDMRKFADAAAMHRINDPSAPQGEHGYYFGDYLGLIGANASSKGQDYAERVMRDPQLILARNRATARFDPRLKHLANLSAAGAGVAGIAGGQSLLDYLTQQEQQMTAEY